MRTLASIQTIEEVTTHPNADALDIVRVLGWRCVAKRDEFKPGDRCIYFEIDSL
ncbi:MAG: RNA ligase (ATP), partial [Candidatus Cryosericum sp.]